MAAGELAVPCMSCGDCGGGSGVVGVGLLGAGVSDASVCGGVSAAAAAAAEEGRGHGSNDVPAEVLVLRELAGNGRPPDAGPDSGGIVFSHS